MRISFVTFLTIAMMIVVGAHLGVYFSWLRFFQITAPNVRRVLGIATIFLSVSFLAASLLIHWRENGLINLFYTFAGVWLGVFHHLIMATLSVWAVAGISRLLGVGVSLRWLGGIALALVVVVSLYALWNAQFPSVHRVEVTLRDLPASWRGRTIVQISDLHLGAINGASFTSRVIDKINEVKPDAVFITGDLFDGAGGDVNSLALPLNNLTPPLGVYFVTGNHESYHGIDRCLQALQKTPVRALRNEIVDLDGIQLVGIDYVMSRQAEATMQKLDPSKPSIALIHVPTLMETCSKYGVDLQLSGHTHVGQLWPFNYITHRVYSGRDHGLFHNGDYTLYTSSGTGTWGPPLRTGNRAEIVAITFK